MPSAVKENSRQNVLQAMERESNVINWVEEHGQENFRASGSSQRKKMRMEVRF